MKYICTKKADGTEEIFTFSMKINHDCMMEAVESIKNQTHNRWIRIHRDIISAGFVSAKGTCFGNSETLGVKSRGDVDTELLKNQYN